MTGLRGRLLHPLEWSLVAVFSCFLFIHTLPRAWSTLNTDFPNYYLVARMVRGHIDTERAYEWRWLQRQKDHEGVEQRVVGLVPITPFSTLFVLPLAHLGALNAKRIWIIAQLLLLLPIALALKSISSQPLRRIALFITASLPLHRNLLFGQFYILLLALLVFACWAYLGKRHATAGMLIAVAAAAKIFPILFLVYYLRRRNWKALVAASLTLGVIAGLSIWVFGWNMHRTYLNSVLPWTLRGQALPPYILASSSLSTLLHRMFMYEPEWNPHPFLNRPSLIPILQPLLQSMILAPALLLVHPRSSGRIRIALEWAALTTATLAISTVPASYNFTLLIFPVVVLCARLLPKNPWKAATVVALYLAIGYTGWNTAPADGLKVLLHVPRLYWLLLFALATYQALGFRSLRAHALQRSALLWACGFAVITAISMQAGLTHVHGLYDDYAYRISSHDDVLMASDPAAVSGAVGSIMLLAEGYRFAPASHPATAANDQLSFAARGEQLWVEETAKTSFIQNIHSQPNSFIADAMSPVLALDGKRVTYIRQSRGHGRLFETSVVATQSQESAVTPEWLDVEEAALLQDGSAIVSGLTAHHPSHLYRVHDQQAAPMTEAGEARFPAASPDGRWIAYSRFTEGQWNLWLMDLQSNRLRRISAVPCNQLEPAWEADSKTLLYASDCGRALWFTAICRRKVIP